MVVVVDPLLQVLRPVATGVLVAAAQIMAPVPERQVKVSLATRMHSVEEEALAQQAVPPVARVQHHTPVVLVESGLQQL
jgi:hypothetical protein